MSSLFFQMLPFITRILFLALAFAPFPLLSQDLYIPGNIKQAYDKHTRSFSGEPGPAYWQNRADHTLDVSFNPDNNILTGKARTIYFNDSPDTLDVLYFHLYPNYYKKGLHRDYDVNPLDEHDGLTIRQITVDGNPLDLTPLNNSIFISHTLMMVRPPDPVMPLQSVILDMSWDYRINKESHLRTGQVDPGSWFFAYFYPHLCVYDDVDGWDTSLYTGEQEFYNDFADYQLSVTVPGQYLVWATGELQNPEDVLAEPYLGRFLESKVSDEIISIIRPVDSAQKVTTRGKSHTWLFRARNVTDVAFGISDHYLWDATSLVVDPADNRRTWIAAAFNKGSGDFYDVCGIARKAIGEMSYRFPAVPFPYPSMTVFNGLSEMEYPMMVNDHSLTDMQEVIDLTCHKIFHTYFPFLMGINETKYAWMDEGWATLGEYLITSVIDTAQISTVMWGSTYNDLAGSDIDLPLFTISNVIRNVPYWNNSYTKAAFFYLILRDYLGEERFMQALQTYIERWKGRHPTPFDFFFTFNDVSGEDLSWLYRPWFFEYGYPDLGIGEVRQIEDQYLVRIRKIGHYPVPVHAKIRFADESEKAIHLDAGIWKMGDDVYDLTVPSLVSIQKIELGHKEIPDAEDRNDHWIVK
ncbi:MAG TPA: M1 family metallopeptidase [Bacteroidales bacterium]|nr:M1 family metallopeptidase [Bacteroidales bacterium]